MYICSLKRSCDTNKHKHAHEMMFDTHDCCRKSLFFTKTLEIFGWNSFQYTCDMTVYQKCYEAERLALNYET